MTPKIQNAAAETGAFNKIRIGNKKQAGGPEGGEGKADKDMASGTEVNQEEYRRLVREISTTKNSLKNLTKEMKNFGSVSAQQIAAAGEDVQEFGGKIETVGKKVSVASATSAAALGASVKLASDYTDAVAKVGTVADLQSVSLEKLRDDMLQLSTETGRGAGEIAMQPIRQFRHL